MVLSDMMKFRGGTVLAVAGLLCSASCGRSKSTAGDQKQPSPTVQSDHASQPAKQRKTAPSEAEPKLVVREIASLGVKAALPETAHISYPTGRRGHVRVRVGSCVAILEPLNSSFALEVTLATTGKADFEHHSGRKTTYWAPKASRWIVKKELGDAFELEYESAKTAGSATSQIVIRRRVGDRPIRCTLDSMSRDATCVRPVCYGLRPTT